MLTENALQELLGDFPVQPEDLAIIRWLRGPQEPDAWSQENRRRGRLKRSDISLPIVRSVSRVSSNSELSVAPSSVRGEGNLFVDIVLRNRRVQASREALGTTMEYSAVLEDTGNHSVTGGGSMPFANSLAQALEGPHTSRGIRAKKASTKTTVSGRVAKAGIKKTPSKGSKKTKTKSGQVEEKIQDLDAEDEDEAAFQYGCTFAKHNESYYEHIHGPCTRPPGVSNQMKYLREHYKDCHSMELRCPRCLKKYKQGQRSQFQEHVKAAACKVVDRTTRPELFTPEQEEAFKTLTRAPYEEYYLVLHGVDMCTDNTTPRYDYYERKARYNDPPAQPQPRSQPPQSQPQPSTPLLNYPDPFSHDLDIGMPNHQPTSPSIPGLTDALTKHTPGQPTPLRTPDAGSLSFTPLSYEHKWNNHGASGLDGFALESLEFLLDDRPLYPSDDNDDDHDDDNFKS